MNDEQKRKFEMANLLAVLAHHEGMRAAAHYVPGEEWRTRDLFDSARNLGSRAETMHTSLGEEIKRDREFGRRSTNKER